MIISMKTILELADAENIDIGAMNSEDGKAQNDCYADPAEAKRFVQATGIDTLACSFGTVHGLYTATPNLDFERIVEMREQIGIPIVMHGERRTGLLP